MKLLGEIVAKCFEPVGGLGIEVFGRQVGKLLVGELGGVIAKLSGTILTKHFWAGAKACNQSFPEIWGNILAKYFWASGRAWQRIFAGAVLAKYFWASGRAWQRSFRATSKFSETSGITLAQQFWVSGRVWQ